VQTINRSISTRRLRSTETSYLSEDPLRFSQIAVQGLRFFPFLSPSNPSHPAHFPARTRGGASPRHLGQLILRSRRRRRDGGGVRRRGERVGKGDDHPPQDSQHVRAIAWKIPVLYIKGKMDFFFLSSC